MPAGTYAVLADIKSKLDIGAAVTKFDTRLNELITDANRDVDDICFLHAVTLPLTGDQAESAADMANKHVCYNFKIEQNAPPEIVKMWKDEYLDAKNKLIAKLDAQPETNTQSQSTAYSQTYRSRLLAERTGL